MPKGYPASRNARALTPAALGRLGEARFAAMCAEVGLLAQRPGEDQNGWDFLIEFPWSLGDGADGDVPQPLHAFVQVKTVWEGARDVDLRLSAAARLGKSPHPTFLCIIEIASSTEAVRLHVLHMAGPLLERVLRKLRQMRAEGRSMSINKAGFRVPVPKGAPASLPRGQDLRDAFDAAIGRDHAAYRAAKDAFLKTAGFPTRPVKGTMTVAAKNAGDYQDFELGLKELPVTLFEASETRWDVTLPLHLPSPVVSVRINQVPKEVEVVWRRPGSLPGLRLKMMTTLAGGPGPDSPHRWRLVHPNVEIRIADGSYTLTIKEPVLVETRYRTLVQLLALETLLGSPGPLRVQIHWMRKLMAEWQHDGSLELRAPAATEGFGEIVRQLGVVLASAGIQDAGLPTGSWRTWQDDLRSLCGILEEPDGCSLSVEVRPPVDTAPTEGEHESLYVTALELGDSYLACYATCRGRLIQDGQSGRWNFIMTEFLVRELHPVEKSAEAMQAFGEVARAETGLNTGLTRWGQTSDGECAGMT